MSQRNGGRLGDSKGADKLARLKAQMDLARPKPQLAVPTAIPDIELRRAMSARRPSNAPSLTQDAARAAITRKNKAKTKGKAKPVRNVRIRSAEERRSLEEALAAHLLNSEPPDVLVSASIPRYDFGEAAYRRLGPLRTTLEGFTASHRGPTNIPPGDQEIIRRRIVSGAEQVAGIVDLDNGYYVGYDFGTSATKVVARSPYASAGVDEAFAIDVPVSIASGGQAHLFPTALYWNKELDRFSLVPGDDYLLLDSFKSALIEGRGHRICNKSGLTMAEAATAFLTLHLAYCLGSALEETSVFKLAAIHVGIPVAVFDGQANVALFDRVFSAATRLIGQATQLSHAKVKTEFQQGGTPALPYSQYAELAGAIAGYCAVPRFYLGGHMIIDCGSATLDIVTFDLNQQTHRPIGIYGASVENLGADACALYIKFGSSVEDCEDAVRFEEHLVFIETIKRKSSLFSQDKGRFPYQIILVGGGVYGEVHAKFLTQLAFAFEKPFCNPKIAPGLRYDQACESGRLILADGLARDPIELRDIVLPKPGPPPVWKDEIAPGKDQV